MPHLHVPEDVDAWFAAYGWFSGRNAAEQASAFVTEVVEESRKGGFPVEPFPAASAFLAEHAGLRVTHDLQREDHLHFTPVPVWCDLFEDMAELSRGLGVRLFPVGWDSGEGEVFVMDEQSRFFNMNSFGNYYLGTGKHEAMIGLFRWPMQDAEDLYV
ncbi:SUKH-3 domain-containing protein [Streptomyces stackebrandtii]|uniref:SUKH-3 domain-containing protein n=1 Tax=Streptomyces stackebrandtii TaxID=3051177 RepID=UPI0028DD07A0|nr:SUKH-3 domain-containing protein [Streptomyces sp. DSM 40976]